MDYWHDVEESQRNLVAENARLRGEVESLRLKVAERPDVFGMVASLTADLARVTEDAAKECGRLRGEMEKLETVAKRIMRQDATFLANERAEGDRLRADLARVTGERDGLLAAARAIDPDSYGDLVRLRCAIAACAPPASGEEDK